MLEAMTTRTSLKQDAVPMLKATWVNFQRHNAQWLAAALAYFTAFAIAPIIIIIVSIASLAIGNHGEALSFTFGYLQRDAGPGANAVRQIVTATFNEAHKGVIAQIIGWVVLVVAAIGLFNAVQFALNAAWEVAPRDTGIWRAIKQRIAGFGVLILVALVFLLSIAMNTGLTLAGGYLTHIFPGFATLLKVVDFVASFGIIWLGFAVLFEYLPECRVEWRDVWAGSALTAFLFVIGQFLLGWYLGRAAVSSGFGAFGSLVVFLIWVNYSAQIMLLGAEFTHVFAQRHGSKAYPPATRGEVDRPTTTATP